MILHDNYPGEDEVYLVTVYTGDVAGAGTTANVCLQLHGNISSSRVNKICIFFHSITHVNSYYNFNRFRSIGYTIQSVMFCNVSMTIGLLFLHQQV